MGSKALPHNSKGLAVSLATLTGGLLSSSCCLLQLVLNYTSVGCAGFSVLTPYRHYFRALTGSLVAYLLFTQGFNRRTLTTIALCAGLVVSQDVVSAHNKGQLKEGVLQVLQTLKGVQQQWLSITPTGGRGRSVQQQQQQPLAASRTQIQVKGMRCEGCAARLRGNIASIEGVDGCTVAFAEGVVEVWSNRSQPVEVSALVQAVKATDGSYSIESVTRDCFDAANQQQPCPAAAGGVAGSDRVAEAEADAEGSHTSEL